MKQKINRYGSDGITREWRKKNSQDNVANTIPIVNHSGGSIMIWDCMSAKGIGNIEVIDGIMDQHVYNNILRNNVKQSAKKMELPHVYTFQQDDSKHTAHINRQWLIWNIPTLLKTPAQSLDLNPIEHLWALLKQKVHQHKPKSIEELKTDVIREWEKIPPEECRKLVNSMHRRCKTIIKANCYASGY